MSETSAAEATTRAGSARPAPTIQPADQPAYQAKAVGRDRVAVAVDPAPSAVAAVTAAEPATTSLSGTNPPDSSIGETGSEEQPWEGRA